MKKYIFRSHKRKLITTFQADRAFWSGTALILLKEEHIVAAIGLMPGDIVVEDGCWKDLPKEETKHEGMSSLVN